MTWKGAGKRKRGKGHESNIHDIQNLAEMQFARKVYAVIRRHRGRRS
jgi:hypothetical protein